MLACRGSGSTELIYVEHSPQAVNFFISHHWFLSFFCCRSVLSEKTRSGSWSISWPMSLMHDPLRSRASTPTHTTGPPIEFWDVLVYIVCRLHPNLPSDYRFRMRQVNIVGTSLPSQPSRKIQTLQAPPDIPPANITLRTASETSLWLRWVVRMCPGMRSICLRGKKGEIDCVFDLFCLVLRLHLHPEEKCIVQCFLIHNSGDLKDIPVSCFI